MKLTTTTQVSVDGVMQANGGPNVLDAYHATRAALLRRLGRSQDSRAAYDKPSSWRATPPRPPT
jgi:predicted RNA polymerase sigma factor